MSSRAPIRLRHAALPLIAMLAERGLDLAIGIKAGYDPETAVDHWRVEMYSRYASDRKTWVGTDVVSVDGQTVTLTAAPDAISAEHEELALADVTGGRGLCFLTLLALPAEGPPLWQCQGPVDFVAAGSELEASSPIGRAISMDLGGGNTIQLTILGNSEQAAAVEVDNAAVNAAIGENAAATREALELGSAALADASDYAMVSHTQSISTVTGLQTALDGKAASDHTQAISTITGLQAALDGKATSAQGAKADTAVQPNSSPTLASIIANDVTFGTGASRVGASSQRVYCMTGYVPKVEFSSQNGSVGFNAAMFVASDSKIVFVDTASSQTGSADLAIDRKSTGLLRVTNGSFSSPSNRDLEARDLIATQYLRPASFTVAAANALVGVATGAVVTVSNEAGGMVLAQYSGSAWKRQTDLATIS